MSLPRANDNFTPGKFFAVLFIIALVALLFH